MSHPASAEEREFHSLLADLGAEVSALRLEVAATKDRVLGLEDQISNPQATSAAAATPAPTPAGYSVGSEREAIARDIGRWIRRCLDGRSPGPSGRDRIRLASKWYLCIRDINRRVHDPPLVFDSWSRCGAHVLRSGTNQPEDSIFIGLPSKTEARLAIQAAGLQIPSLLSGRDEP